VRNCLISDGGLVHYSAHGIWLGITDGSHVAHNVVRRFPYSAVSVGWSWNDKPTPCKDNVIERNHIHDAMMLLADGGGIYSLGFQPGTVMRGNLIHDVHRSAFTGRAPNNGIFFDQGSKGYLVEDNVIYSTAQDPVRYNQSGQDLLDFRRNFLGVSPQDPAYPAQIAGEAGLEPAFMDLERQDIAATPPPIYSMTPPPPPPPTPITEGFEGTPIGAVPPWANAAGQDGGASVGVTDGEAATGERSLMFVDSATAPKSFYPYLWCDPEVSSGHVSVSFAIKLDPAAIVDLSARQANAGPYGPALNLSAAAGLQVGGEHLLDVPHSEWIKLALFFGTGDDATGQWDLRVELPDGASRSFPGLPFRDDGFRQLRWLGLTGGAAANARFFIDDVSVLVE